MMMKIRNVYGALGLQYQKELPSVIPLVVELLAMGYWPRVVTKSHTLRNNILSTKETTFMIHQLRAKSAQSLGWSDQLLLWSMSG